MGKEIAAITCKYIDKSIRFNRNQYNILVDIANESRRNFSTTVRLILYMGLKEWELNRLAGRITKKAIEADYAKRKAEAETTAMRKAAASQSKGKRQEVTQAVTPMLFNPDENE